ncbi:MAG: multidrug efflux pump subunit AcrA (membrane-fusion protein) [Planctomycetota bacterium]|jgi:multidrug efflux pump subunit AcrA (membrane-fusion protein)
MKRWDIIVFSIIFTAIGGVGGWIAAEQRGAGAAHKEDEVTAPEAAPKLSKQTLGNLGVTVAEIQPTTFVRTRAIPAMIAATASTRQPVFAPIGGRVLELMVEPGAVVKAGETIFRMARDPIPRPTLTLTSGILKPAQESIHEGIVNLRKAKREISITKTEIARITKFTGKVGKENLPILPRQTLIDLRYRLLRAEDSQAQAELELHTHGFTDEQVAAMEKGADIPGWDQGNWKRALQRNGLWSATAEKLHANLPQSMRSLPWVVATTAELAAGGLINQGLIDWLKGIPGDCEHFLEIGSLLQRGYSINDIKLLHDMNALDPIVDVKAPKLGGLVDWDVVGLDVTPGAHVEAGTKVVILADRRSMYLKTEPVGGENADVLNSMRTNRPCRAVPLVGGTGIEIDDVKLSFVTSAEGSHGSVAFAKVKNEVLSRSEDGLFRSWQLRAGTKYVLHVPVQELKNVYVLPSGAVTSDGPNRLIFIQDGDAFRPIEVEIIYQDEEFAVLPITADGHLFPGDPIVQSGAYALGLALKTNGKIDPHAGHTH